MSSIHAKRDRRKFPVSGRNLKPGTTYGIRVAGVRIGSLTTRATGSGAARFSSPQHGSDQFLGVDPRGKKVEVSDDQGEFFFSSRRRHTRYIGDWSSDVCSSD